jgi:hypothetical protein
MIIVLVISETVNDLYDFKGEKSLMHKHRKPCAESIFLAKTTFRKFVLNWETISEQYIAEPYNRIRAVIFKRTIGPGHPQPVLICIPCNACKTNTLRRLGVARQNSYLIYTMYHATHVKQIPCDA